MSTCGLDDKWMPFRLVLPKNDDRRWFSTQCQTSEITESNRSVGQRVLNAKVEADCHQKYHVWETPVRCTATAVTLRVAARQRGACFAASYQRQNELTKQHTKQIAADDLQAEKEPRELGGLHTKHDVN
eukprot:6191494-Pleurochrysis_carterae.AAC.1